MLEQAFMAISVVVVIVYNICHFIALKYVNYVVCPVQIDIRSNACLADIVMGLCFTNIAAGFILLAIVAVEIVIFSTQNAHTSIQDVYYISVISIELF